MGHRDVSTTAGGDPLVIIKESESGGRSVYFSGALGSLAWTVPYPDLQRLIANAVRWAAHDVLPLRVTAPPTLQVSLRTQASARRMVHLINLTGGERFFRELVPLYDVIVELPAEAGCSVERAFMLSDGAALPVAQVDGVWRVTVPRVVDYDVLVFELSQDQAHWRAQQTGRCVQQTGRCAQQTGPRVQQTGRCAQQTGRCAQQTGRLIQRGHLWKPRSWAEPG